MHSAYRRTWLRVPLRPNRPTARRRTTGVGGSEAVIAALVSIRVHEAVFDLKRVIDECFCSGAGVRPVAVKLVTAPR
jgi:hypothetical protein